MGGLVGGGALDPLSALSWSPPLGSLGGLSGSSSLGYDSPSVLGGFGGGLSGRGSTVPINSDLTPTAAPFMPSKGVSLGAVKQMGMSSSSSSSSSSSALGSAEPIRRRGPPALQHQVSSGGGAGGMSDQESSFNQMDSLMSFLGEEQDGVGSLGETGGGGRGGAGMGLGMGMGGLGLGLGGAGASAGMGAPAPQHANDSKDSKFMRGFAPVADDGRKDNRRW